MSLFDGGLDLMTQNRPRVLWLAGTRGEVLRLAPYALKFLTEDEPRKRLHWFAVTGEQGVAVYQALDDCGLRPHAEAELRHPAEDPAARLQGLLGEIETLARRYRATHLVFAGAGPTAAAASLVCHGREARGVWIPPHDPAGLIPRFRWERGLTSVIRSLGESVASIEPPGPEELSGSGDSTRESGKGPSGRRPGSPLVLVSVTRPAWGLSDLPERLIRRLREWADHTPEADWLFLRSLDARFEGPLQALPDAPRNLLTAPPVPFAVYHSWLQEAKVLITDSPSVAAEGIARGLPVLAIGEDRGQTNGGTRQCLLIGQEEIADEPVDEWIRSGLRENGQRPNNLSIWPFSPDLAERLGGALGGE